MAVSFFALRSLGVSALFASLWASCTNHGTVKDPPNPSGPEPAAPVVAKGSDAPSATPVATGETSCTNEPAAACASTDSGSSSTTPPATPAAASVESSFLLAIPFAGSCRFGDCLKNGWDGDVRADCKFSDCSKDGWTATLSSQSASTDCSFQKCFSSGWGTRLADGSRIDVSCNFSNCLKDAGACAWARTRSA